MNQTVIERSGIGRQNPFTFYLSVLLYMLLALLVRVVACLPLAALFLFKAEPALRWLALLCPVLIVFFVLPLRFSFAQAFTKHGFSLRDAFNFSQYGEKLGESLLHALHVILWGIPLAAMLGACAYFYEQTDVITLLNWLNSIGAGASAVWAAVVNFVVSIFGGTPMVPNGGLMEGVYTVGVVLALGLLILLFGALRNSSFRYIWAVADRVDKDPRAEARRRLLGRRWGQLGIGMINLVLWAPAVYMLMRTLKGLVENLSNALFLYISTKQMNLPALGDVIWPLLFTLLVCYLPLLPIRRLFTARFATRGAARATVVMPEISGDDTLPTTSGTPEPLKAEGSRQSAQFYRMGYEGEAPKDRKPVAAYQPPKTAHPAAGEAPYQPELTETARLEAPAAEPEEEMKQPEAYRQTEPVQTAEPKEDQPSEPSAESDKE